MALKGKQKNQHTLPWPPSFLPVHIPWLFPFSHNPFQLLFLFCLSNVSSYSNSQKGSGIFPPTWYLSILYICLSTLHERNFQSKLLSDFFLKCFLPLIQTKDSSKVKESVSLKWQWFLIFKMQCCMN